MAAYWEIIRATLIVVGVGGFGWWLFYLFTRTKKITYKARVYQLSNSTRVYKTKRAGEELSFRLHDLKEYMTDTIERVEEKKQIIHRLVTLKLPLPVVESNIVETWAGEKWVNILIINEAATILRKGYDEIGKHSVFEPMPVDETNMIIQQAQYRKDRNAAKKSLLEAITPWVVIGISMMTLVGVTFLMVNGALEISKNNREGMSELKNAMLKMSENNKDAIMIQAGIMPPDKPGVEVEIPGLGVAEPPPSIE